MTDFFDSPQGKHAIIAKQYLEGALSLNEAQQSKGRILLRPTLALAGHGLEMMLKACHYLNGEKPPTNGRKGHDIVSLWEREVCQPVRSHVFSNARFVAVEDRASGHYPDVPGEDDILPLIEEYVVELGRLHGAAGYPLRYPSHPDQDAPRTPFLVRTLWRTADDMLKRPNEFELAHRTRPAPCP